MPALKLFSMFFSVNETWKGSFQYTADNIHAIYITSVIFYLGWPRNTYLRTDKHHSLDNCMQPVLFF